MITNYDITGDQTLIFIVGLGLTLACLYSWHCYRRLGNQCEQAIDHIRRDIYIEIDRLRRDVNGTPTPTQITGQPPDHVPTSANTAVTRDMVIDGTYGPNLPAVRFDNEGRIIQ